MTQYQSVLRTQDLGPGSVIEVKAHGRSVALVNVGQTYYAVDARCPDDGTNLARAARLDDELLVCPVDDAAFNVRTGDRVGGGAPLRTYPINVTENDIRVGPAN